MNVYHGLAWRALLGLALAFSLAMSALAADTGIEVAGSGVVSAKPDLARVHLVARREGSDAVSVKQGVDDVATQVIALSREFGVAPADLTAAAVSLFPRYGSDGNSTVVNGVIAERTFVVTLRDLELLSRFIDTALERGINGVQGIHLDVSNRSALEATALERAIDAAREEAQRVADRFGVQLGSLLAATTQDQSAPRPFLRMEAMAASAPDSFAPGELEIRRAVTARFAIALR
ncbi:MAG: SIMPL domain-containing protein [Pseudomonadales bacterium]